MLAIIVAMDSKRGIGKDNQLLWHISADLKHFKQLTQGHTVIMGRKCFESIGKILPNRRNIICSRNPNFKAPGADIAISLTQAMELAKDDKNIFIIGGSEIYSLALESLSIDRIYLTQVSGDFSADRFFPKLMETQWKVESETDKFYDTQSKCEYQFLILVQKDETV